MASADIGIGVQKILVTGGAGFIGSHLVDALVNGGYEVTILDNLSSGKVENMETHLSNKAVRLVEGDVRNMNEVKEALTGVDGVFHLAAITSVPYSVENPTITNQVNAMGTRNLLEMSSKKGVKRFIYVSSCAVYGEPQYVPIDEEHPLKPMSPYAESKLRGEEYCEEFSKEHRLNTVTLRLFNVYGPRQGTNERGGVITKFIKNIKDGRPLTIYGDGEQTRDFVHVNDIVQALLLSMNISSAIGETFNIGAGKSVTINELRQLILRELKAEIKQVYEKSRPGDIRHSCAKIEKAQELLRYKPRVSLDKGIKDLCASTDVLS